MTEADQVRASFNAAIDFALDRGGADFLRAWREGDTSEWPKFKPPYPLADLGGVLDPPSSWWPAIRAATWRHTKTALSFFAKGVAAAAGVRFAFHIVEHWLPHQPIDPRELLLFITLLWVMK